MNKKFFLPSLAAIFLTALFIKNPELTSACVKSGLESCFLTIIPSLFPFMVVAEILCECGALDFFSRILGKRASRIWGLSPKAMASVLSGLILGFPIGTRALTKLYDNGEISSDELRAAIGFCGIPSFGFIVNVMGISLFSSKSFGLFMYFAAIISALLSGIVFTKRGQTQYDFVSPPRKKEKSSAEIITGAISSSAGATITLCAYVIFFSCIVGCISELIVSEFAGAFIGSVLELSTGVLACAGMGGTLGIALCGFSVGWSGLSVHFQTAALISERVTSYSEYFMRKLCQGLLCSAFALVYTLTTDFKLASTNIAVVLPVPNPNRAAVVFIIFILCMSISVRKIYNKNP